RVESVAAVSDRRTKIRRGETQYCSGRRAACGYWRIAADTAAATETPLRTRLRQARAQVFERSHGAALWDRKSLRCARATTAKKRTSSRRLLPELDSIFDVYR